MFEDIKCKIEKVIKEYFTKFVEYLRKRKEYLIKSLAEIVGEFFESLSENEKFVKAVKRIHKNVQESEVNATEEGS